MKGDASPFRNASTKSPETCRNSRSKENFSSTKGIQRKPRACFSVIVRCPISSASRWFLAATEKPEVDTITVGIAPTSCTNAMVAPVMPASIARLCRLASTIMIGSDWPAPKMPTSICRLTLVFLPTSLMLCLILNSGGGQCVRKNCRTAFSYSVGVIVLSLSSHSPIFHIVHHADQPAFNSKNTHQEPLDTTGLMRLAG